jgi:transposase
MDARRGRAVKVAVQLRRSRTAVGKVHPLRTIRGAVNEALASLSSELSALYALLGRPSIPPEKLLRAMLLQVFYTIRSERRLMARLQFDLLFRWFVGMGVDDRAWDHSTFSKNRERLLEGGIAAKPLSAVMAQPRVKRLLSSDHFLVDGTLSFRPRDEGCTRPERQKFRPGWWERNVRTASAAVAAITNPARWRFPRAAAESPPCAGRGGGFQPCGFRRLLSS